MADQRSVMKEYRLLEQKRASNGLSAQEEARFAQLRDLVGPDAGVAAARPGFDVNAAAARLRESLLPAGLRNRPASMPEPPPEPPPEPEPATTPASGTGLEAVWNSAPFAPLAEPQGLAEDALFDPGSLGADGSAEPAWDPNAQPYDPNAQPYDPNAPQQWDAAGQGWDPNAQPYDPNAPQQWDANAAQQWDANGQPYDPNAQPYDPNAPQQWDANAAQQWDANGQPYDPNAQPYDPNAPQQWDANAAQQWDTAAQPAWDPNLAAPWGEAQGAEPLPETTEGAPAAEQLEAEWGAEPLPSEPTTANEEQRWEGEGGAAEELASAEPAQWDGTTLSSEEQPSAEPPIDAGELTVEPPLEAAPELTGVASFEPGEPAPETDGTLAEPAFEPSFGAPEEPPLEAAPEPSLDAAEAPVSESAVEPSFEVPEALESETALEPSFGAPEEPPLEAAPEPSFDVSMDFAPEETAEPAPEGLLPFDAGAASAVGAGAVPEGWGAEAPSVDFVAPEPAFEPSGEGYGDLSPEQHTQVDALPSDEAKGLLAPLGDGQELTSDDDAFAQGFHLESNGSFGKAAAPTAPTWSAQPPASESEAWESAPSLDLATMAPAGGLPPLDLSPSAPGKPPDPGPASVDALDEIDVEEIPIVEGSELLEELPPEPAASVHMAGTHRVVVHTVEGLVKRGVITDVELDADTLPLAPQPDAAPERLPTGKVKAIFFMLSAGEQAPTAAGKKVRVTFNDGRQIAGFSPDYSDTGPGFFMIPADTRTNTGRIWVYRAAVKSVAVS